MNIKLNETRKAKIVKNVENTFFQRGFRTGYVIIEDEFENTHILTLNEIKPEYRIVGLEGKIEWIKTKNSGFWNFIPNKD